MVMGQRVASITVASTLVLFACSTMKVQTAKDPQANLSKYKTYTWAPESASPGSRPHASILDQTVKASLEKELAKKGLVRAENTEPDLWVSYFAVSRESLTYGVSPGYS